ncbi:ExbD/TolR family protein [Hydrogenophilus thermoluteolus]|uniref:Biopolymer transporter ExbD n=1 Tax=Hydrogenophilus thermoluteolus TaxID=297 RepID=A0A2Z6DWD9_HYDTE|nr:biopolymer transporter ExbD [Hydrogenophilus thermoluteolus]BBD76774.1 biopolymer transporter ExbD [Hydrogenophilus thermoluteolus]
MSHGIIDENGGDLNSEINMIPLIDVMLVLLIVFIVTIPVIRHSISVSLPKATMDADKTEEPVKIVVASDGTYFWNNDVVDLQELEARLEDISSKSDIPGVQVLGDRSVSYEKVVQLLALVSRSGIQSVGLVTEPEVK